MRPQGSWTRNGNPEHLRKTIRESQEILGGSNFSVEQIQQARQVVHIVSVQNQFNLWHRQPEFDGVLDYCEQEGLIFFSPRPSHL